VSHELDGRRVPYVAKPYRTVLLNTDELLSLRTLADLAWAVDSDTTTIANVLLELPARVRGIIADVKVAGELVEIKLKDGPNSWVKLSNLRQVYPPGLISLPLELAVAFAQIQAEVEPTLLVIDEIGPFSREVVQYVYSFLADSAFAFQIVLATVRDPPDDHRGEWLLTTFRHGTLT
jgi:hypothetical protein